MMSEKSNDEALETTLQLAGIKNPNLRKIKILEFGGANDRSAKIVHDATNKILFNQLSESDLGLCVHVTGEMRALIDPFHRQLCEEMVRLNKGQFQVLFYAPEDKQADNEQLVSWNLERWTRKSKVHWKERIKTINTIANQCVDILAYDTRNEIQYSVFGNKYVLLQERHSDSALNKRVWLLEAERVNEELSEKAMSFINNAKNINEVAFRDFSLNLTTVAAKRILSMVHDLPKEVDSILNDSLVRNFTRNPEKAFGALKAMKFIEEIEDNKIKITDSGREFSVF
ncbi:MAG: hypothetical protein K0R49_1283 [Burkholderiales bacterium]|jgi:hypothetical protein|nr:hypothetical protein [Burkholderiales bacterium]